MMLWRGPSPCPIGGVEGLYVRGLRCLAFVCIYSILPLICVSNTYLKKLLYMKGNGVPAYLQSNGPRSDHNPVGTFTTLLPLSLYPLHSTTSSSFSTSRACLSQLYLPSLAGKPSAGFRGCTSTLSGNCSAS